MTVLRFSLHDGSAISQSISQSATDNETSVSKADIQSMLARISALENKVEALQKSHRHCSCASKPAPHGQSSAHRSRSSPSRPKLSVYRPQPSLLGNPQWSSSDGSDWEG